MSNNDTILNLSRKSRLSAEVTYLMLKGAGYAAAFLIVIGLVYAVIHGVGMLLPEESKTAPDPINRSSLEMPVDVTDVA
jgi:hypothetical protein